MGHKAKGGQQAAEPKPETTPQVAPETPKAPKTPKRQTEAELALRFPGIVAGSLEFAAEGKYANKQTVERALPCCGVVVRLASSDLHQVARCAPCAKAHRKEAKKTRRIERKAALATLAAQTEAKTG